MQSNKVQPGVLVRIVLVLLALLALLIAYYWTHKPFDLPTFAVLGGALLDILTIGALFAIGGAVGRAVIDALASRLSLDLRLLSRAERFALETTFGLMLIAIAALTLGIVGLFRSLFFWVPLLALALLLRQNVKSWLTDMKAMLAAARPGTRWGWLLLGFIVVMLALALLHSLAPPYSLDSMTYHLVGPQRYLADGRMTPQPENFYLGFPKSMEMLFSVTISLFGRDTAAAPVHFGFGLLGLMAVGGFVRRYTGSLDVALLAVVLLLSSFSVWLLLGWSYVDLAVLTMSAVAFSVANLWRETKDQNWLVLLGLICGFALGFKYTSGLLAAALGLYLLVYQPRRFLRNGLIFGIAASIAFLPWMIRAALHYGNPVYPYIFNGLNWDAGRTALFSQYDRGFASLDRVWQLFLMPFSATIFGVSNGEPFEFTLNPWLFTLPFLLPVVWRWLDDRERRLSLGAALLALPIFLFWAISASYAGIAMQTRLMIVLFPIGAVLGALVVNAFSRLGEKPVNMSFVLRGMLALTLLTGSLEVLNRFTSSKIGSYMLGQTSKDDYLFLHLATYPATQALLAELPTGSQVRFLWEPRSYYCPPTVSCIPDVLFDQWSARLTPEFPPEAVFNLWRELGDDYVLFFRLGYDAYVNFIAFHPEENAIVPEMLERHLVEVWTTPDERYTLYAWAGE
jgi:hypothetical protein